LSGDDMLSSGRSTGKMRFNAMKALVILLVILVVLFLVLMVWAAKSNGSQTPSSDKKQASTDFFKRPHPNLDFANGWLSPLSPKLKASSLTPARNTFELAGQAPYQVAVAADPDHKFRQAKFLVQPAKTCATVLYKARDANADSNLTKQNSDDSNDPKHPNEFTLTILESGGNLTFTANSTPCKVTLE
jgi:hypothetical protein